MPQNAHNFPKFSLGEHLTLLAASVKPYLLNLCLPTRITQKLLAWSLVNLTFINSLYLSNDQLMLENANKFPKFS